MAVNVEELSKQLLAASKGAKDSSSYKTEQDRLLSQVESQTDVESKLETLWTIVITAALQTTTAEELDWIVGLLDSLQTSAFIVEARKQEIWGNKYEEGELPILGAHLREQLESAHSSAQQFSTFSAFAARLTTSHVDDFRLYALWTIREALEDATVDDFAGPSSSRNVISLAGAATWYKEAAPLLLKASNEDYAFDGRMGRPGAAAGGELADDLRGFSTARWALWKKRLQGIAATASEAQAKQYADEALKAIASAEQSH